MKRRIAQLILVVTLPALILAMGFKSGMYCKMGMRNCSQCCVSKEIPTDQPKFEQISCGEGCCGSLPNSSFSAVNPAKNFEKFSQDGSLNPATTLPIISVINPNSIGILGPASFFLPKSSPPLFLLKQSILC